MIVTRELLDEVALTQDEYDLIVSELGRVPSMVELGMFGSLWSEHCGYKNSKPLLRQFPTTAPWVLQGPGENAGIVDIGNGLAIALKVESHNHPSAVEPFQGAATGVGGIVRDIFTMGARPIAILDSLRFGPLDERRNRYLLGGVVGGIAAYGNCIGVPTVGGEIAFDPSLLRQSACERDVRGPAAGRRDSCGPRPPASATRYYWSAPTRAGTASTGARASPRASSPTSPPTSGRRCRWATHFSRNA